MQRLEGSGPSTNKRRRFNAFPSTPGRLTCFGTGWREAWRVLPEGRVSSPGCSACRDRGQRSTSWGFGVRGGRCKSHESRPKHAVLVLVLALACKAKLRRRGEGAGASAAVRQGRWAGMRVFYFCATRREKKGRGSVCGYGCGCGCGRWCREIRARAGCRRGKGSRRPWAVASERPMSSPSPLRLADGRWRRILVSLAPRLRSVHRWRASGKRPGVR